MKTGNTALGGARRASDDEASMEPGHEDREYRQAAAGILECLDASMEPGHEDREYAQKCAMLTAPTSASMEPGHEDREYAPPRRGRLRHAPPQWSPVMKTGNTRTV